MLMYYRLYYNTRRVVKLDGELGVPKFRKVTAPRRRCRLSEPLREFRRPVSVSHTALHGRVTDNLM